MGFPQGSTPYKYIAAASANQDSQSVKTAAGWVDSITITGVAAAIEYVKLYDLATAPTSANTPAQTYGIPGSSTGSSVQIPIPNGGMVFQNGIAFRMTTGQADSNASAVTAGDLVLSLTYR